MESHDNDKSVGGRPRKSRVFSAKEPPFSDEINSLLEMDLPYNKLSQTRIRKLDEVIQARVKKTRDSWNKREREEHRMIFSEDALGRVFTVDEYTIPEVEVSIAE